MQLATCNFRALPECLLWKRAISGKNKKFAATFTGSGKPD
jgi:hypothetical protein